MDLQRTSRDNVPVHHLRIPLSGSREKPRQLPGEEQPGHQHPQRYGGLCWDSHSAHGFWCY
ncbi:hypothetical protein H8959_003319 [Pygathrix nigripes]